MLLPLVLLMACDSGTSVSGSDSTNDSGSSNPSYLSIELQKNGSGEKVSDLQITLGDSITVFAVSRSSENKFIGNVPASWSLSGDIGSFNIQSGGKEAIFSAQSIGSGYVSVSYQGLSQKIDIVVSPPDTTTLSLDDPTVNASAVFPNSDLTTFTLTNTGDIEATGISSTIATPFAIDGSSNCTTTLSAGDSCSIVVRFSPPGEGVFSEDLNISYFDGDSTQQIQKSISQNGVAETLGLAANYPVNGASLLQYVTVSDANETFYNQADTACSGAETVYANCIHAGEVKKSVTGATSCNGLTALDQLGAFDWTCDDSSGFATFYSQLKNNQGLSNLIDFSALDFLDNKIVVMNAGYKAGESPLEKWWSPSSNPIYDLPASTSNTQLSLDGVDDDAGGPDQVFISGTIFVVDSSMNSDGYNFKKNRLAIVVKPGEVLSFEGDSSSYNFMTVTADFVWLEGKFNCSGSSFNAAVGIKNYRNMLRFNMAEVYGANGEGVDSYSADGADGMVNSSFYNNGGIGFKLARGAYIRNSNFYGNGSAGLTYSYGLDAKNIRAYNNGGTGISQYYSSSAKMENIIAYGNGTDGLILGDNTKAYNLYLANNGKAGLRVPSGKVNNYLVNVSLVNNKDKGFDSYGGVTSTLVNALVANNNSSGTSASSAYTHLNSTFINNTGTAIGSSYRSGSDYINTVVINNNNAMMGGSAPAASNALFHHFLVDYVEGKAIDVRNATGQDFSGILAIQDFGLVSGVACDVGAGSPLVDSTCTLTGSNGEAIPSASGATFYTDMNLTNSFVGKVTSDSINLDHTLGQASYASISDFSAFENSMRTWGKDGSGFPSFDEQGACDTGEICQIWDFRLKASDTVLRNRSFDGRTANEDFVAGTTCPSAVQGNVVITDQASRTFLIHAYEIMFDGAGNDNGLCESNEACIYTPNLGTYQGHGDYLNNGTCDFQDGTVTDVEMYAFPTNGV